MILELLDAQTFHRDSERNAMPTAKYTSPDAFLADVSLRKVAILGPVYWGLALDMLLLGVAITQLILWFSACSERRSIRRRCDGTAMEDDKKVADGAWVSALAVSRPMVCPHQLRPQLVLWENRQLTDLHCRYGAVSVVSVIPHCESQKPKYSSSEQRPESRMGDLRLS